MVGTNPSVDLPEDTFAGEIVRTIDTSVAVFDVECRYLYINPASVKDPIRRASIIGKTDVEYAQQWNKDVSVAENRMRHMQKALRENEPVDIEEKLVTTDGRTLHFVRKFRPVPAGDGRPVRLLAYGFDITEIRQAQEALVASEKRFLQAQKMEAIGLLAGGIAHDFNNLLTVIGLHAELVSTPGLGPAEREDDVGEIRKALSRAQNLTAQLLAFGRRQILQPQVLSLNAVVKDTESVIRRLLPEHIAVAIDTAEDLQLARVDPGQLGQVLMNLVVNARDAMPSGGTLTIATGNKSSSDKMCILYGSSGDHVMLSVSDTGMGMDEATKRRLFEPFFTAKGKLNGTGLGLATVYGIVTQSAGCIEVDSEPGEGSTFRVYFPVTDGEAEWPKSAEIEPASAPIIGRVLLAEDEDAVRQGARRVLERMGWEVIAASNGVDAIEQYERLGGPVDLLLTDIVMPEMGGIELAEAMSSLQPGIRIVIMSGYTEQDEDLKKKMSAYGAVFLPKPFSVHDLERKLDAVSR